MSRWVLIGIIVFAGWTATVFLLGRQSKNCPQISVPTPAAALPETKPLKPDTVWRDSVTTIYRDTGHTVTETETLRVIEKVTLPLAVFPNRIPHTGDSLWVDTAKMEATLKPFGFILAPMSPEGRLSMSTHRSLLEVGYTAFWRSPDQLWATLPNPVKDRRLFYWPDRFGAAWQPITGKWGITVSWTVF